MMNLFLLRRERGVMQHGFDIPDQLCGKNLFSGSVQVKIGISAEQKKSQAILLQGYLSCDKLKKTILVSEKHDKR